MRIDSTFPARKTENFQDIRKRLQRMGNLVRTQTKNVLLDFPMIIEEAEIEVQVNEVQPGDSVSVAPPPGFPSGLSVSGYVSYPGVVTVRLTNNGSGAVDLAKSPFLIVATGYEDGAT